MRIGRQLGNWFGRTYLNLLPKLRARALKRYGSVLWYVAANSNPMISEAVGMTFARGVCLMRRQSIPRVIQVTSSVPNEGKTNLIDLDLRRPSLAKALAVPEQDRLIGFLSGAAAAHCGGYADEETGLEICGLLRGVRNLSAALDRERLRALLDQLTDRCDSVVLDNPAVLGMRDSRLISSVVDAVIFLVRWEATSRGFVDAAIKRLREVDARIAGAALSIVDIRKQKRYDYMDRTQVAK